MQRAKRRSRNSRTIRKQKDVIRDVVLSAGQCGTWLTLEELTKLTHFPAASISAQLRHLRKPQNGAFAVEKRVRKVDKALRGDGFGAMWEYRVWRGAPSILRYGSAGRRIRHRTTIRLALQPAGL